MANTAFFAYPGEPPPIGQSINDAICIVDHSRKLILTPWQKLDIIGLKIDDLIRDRIEASDFLFADITVPNFNVYYEIGYALARQKPLIPTVNTSYSEHPKNINLLGIFDTIWQCRYQNARELANKIIHSDFDVWINKYISGPDYTQPLFFLDTFAKTDFRNWVVQFIGNSSLQYRSYDPTEVPRLSAPKSISELSASAGAIIPLLSTDIQDNHKHNLRAAFVAGLAHGFSLDPLIIQYANAPAPLDFRDFVDTVRTRYETAQSVNEYCQKTLIQNQRRKPRATPQSETVLQRIDLGASSAENEFQNLHNYFVETAEYNRALRGPSSIVVGRKGSEKSAIFYRVGDYHKSDARNLVVDLRPASHNLSELRIRLLELMDIGLFDHTIAAFWQSIIFREILLEVRSSILPKSRYSMSILEQARNIEATMSMTEEYAAADFTSRLDMVIRSLIDRLPAMPKGPSFTRAKITNILFQEDISSIRNLSISSCAAYNRIVLLFDDLDEGWPAKRVESEDIRIIRILLEALASVQREMDRGNVDFQHIVFLRNDVYEILIEQTSDRGKFNLINVDWSDPEQLRRLMEERAKFGILDENISSEGALQLVIPNYRQVGDYFPICLQYSLMRPRFLIDLCERSLSCAVNRGHLRVESDDVDYSLRQHSMYLVSEFGYEIRDVSGLTEDIFYHFIGKPALLSEDESRTIISAAVPEWRSDDVIELFLWYGFVGVARSDEEKVYIFDFNYDVRRLIAEARSEGKLLVYCINPAFLAGLS